MTGVKRDADGNQSINGPAFVFVGSSSAGQAAVPTSPGFGKVKVDKQEKGIRIFEVEADGHSLRQLGQLNLEFHVGWLAFHPRNGHMYGIGDGQVLAFSLSSTGDLKLVSSAETVGNGAHLELSADGKWVIIASYSGGALTVVPILADGSLGQATDSKHHEVKLNPTLADRQESCHPHQVRLDPQIGKWALSCDLGADCVWVYEFDSVRGSLVGAANSHRHLKLKEGSGPRHLDFHPSGKWVYVLNELSGDLVICDWDADRGILSQPKQAVYVMPEGERCSREHHSGLAHVLVSADGQYVYASSRTDNSIAVFKVNGEDGAVQKVQYVPSCGICPRNFHLDYSLPSRPCLRVGNQDSQNIVEYNINASTGFLEEKLITSLDGMCPNVVTVPIRPFAV